MNKASETLITDWFRRARESQQGHYACSNHYARLNYVVGIPTIAIATIVGTATFASLESGQSETVRIAVGIISILAAVLAGLQTFLRFSEKTEKHKATATGYSRVRRELEVLKTFPPEDENELKRRIDDIKKEMDSLAEAAPTVSPRITEAVVERLKNRPHRRIFFLPGGTDSGTTDTEHR